MKIIFEILERIYLKIILFKPKLISAIIFIPILYILGWFMAKPIIFIGINKDDISLIGTIFTFIIFMISLPTWFRVRWGLQDTWKLIGIKNKNNHENLVIYFLKGSIYASILISLILTLTILSQSGKWLGLTSPSILINTIFLTLGIGFSEEIIFRGWLLEEFKNQFGLKKALIFQAAIFSLVHIGFDMPTFQMIKILFGLFLLGFLLGLMRIKDNNSLWSCIGMHGVLVGGWFMVNNGLMKFSKDSPEWLVGPGIIQTNPLGGFLGISLLILLIIFTFLDLRKKVKP